jgi:hypothetical protein
MLKVPTEAEAFAEFSRLLKERREQEGSPRMEYSDVRRYWTMLESFRKAWGLKPSSTTPSAPHGGDESGHGS